MKNACIFHCRFHYFLVVSAEYPQKSSVRLTAKRHKFAHGKSTGVSAFGVHNRQQ